MKPSLPTRAAAVAVVLLAVGCGADQPDPGPRFNDEAQQDITCMTHQTAPPGLRYTDTDLRRTDETLLVLKYYTAHANKSYCDGAGPTDTDKSWAALYVDLGADRTNVATLLDQSGG